MRTAIILIATGKYWVYVHDMLNSIRNHWTELDPDVLVLTDHDFKNGTDGKTYYHHLKHQPWPYPTMYRYHYFLQLDLDFYDYVYYVDVDARFVADVGTEVIGDLVAVQHCGYVQGGGSFEDNENSVLYWVDTALWRYYAGGFQGGRKENYRDVWRWCSRKLDQDLANGIVPRHHDETAFNVYCNLIAEPDVVLTPDYHYPENDGYFIANCWGGKNPYSPKLLLLEKEHEKMRS